MTQPDEEFTRPVPPDGYDFEEKRPEPQSSTDRELPSQATAVHRAQRQAALNKAKTGTTAQRLDALIAYLEQQV